MSVFSARLPQPPDALSGRCLARQSHAYPKQRLPPGRRRPVRKKSQGVLPAITPKAWDDLLRNYEDHS